MFLFRRYLFDWFDRKWGYKLKKYEKWQTYLDRYGIWTLVLLRTIPIVPSNIINLMSAVSPMKPAAFCLGGRCSAICPLSGCSVRSAPRSLSRVRTGTVFCCGTAYLC
ncbi:VTT domain-containing protein [Paenibacillus rhizoplanae]